MLPPKPAAILAVALALFSGCAQPAPPPPARPAPVRIMPLGDSLTEGYCYPGSYRVRLWQRFQENRYNAVFVGSEANGPPELGSQSHEGHGGWKIHQVAERVDGWITRFQPNAILLCVGTNDLWDDHNIPAVLNRLANLIDQICDRTRNNLVLIVAAVPPTQAEPAYDARVEAYANAIPALLDSKAAEGRPVLLADFREGLSLEDGVHPDKEGSDQMGDIWWAALQGKMVGCKKEGPRTKRKGARDKNRGLGRFPR